MLHVVESRKSVQEVEAQFSSVAAKHKFGVLGTHNLRQKLNEKGVPFEKECLVFEVCQPLQAGKVLSENMSISTALPCRISVYREGGKTRIATLKPTVLLEMFGTPALKQVAEEVERAIFAIMEDLR
jgi:uncharacterized protein (DUF302 family)